MSVSDIVVVYIDNVKNKRGKHMQKDIGFYDDLFTPYDYSYSPYTNMWYQDSCENMPEPDTEPEEVKNFKLVDELGDWALCEGDEEYYDYEENQEDFKKYVRYICGENDLRYYDSFSASILLKSENQKKYIYIDAWELVGLEEFIKNINLNNYSTLYIEAYTGAKFFVWNKENNKIRLIVQQYGLGSVGYIDYNLLTVDYDALINKDEFISEFLNFINKYKNLLFSAIKEYEIQHNIKFTNPQNIKYIDCWIKK